MRERVLEELQKIEIEMNVRILLAVEAGSRTWDFASEDSDYDVRFIYVRKVEDYLRINSFSDTIEHKVSDDLDMVGWDIRKALSMLSKSNTSVLEWCNSSI